MIKACNCFINQLHIEAPLSPLSSSSSFSPMSVSSSEIESAESNQAKLLSSLRHLTWATTSLCVSERLPRSEDLIFLNLTTLEGDSFCVELTKRGWRIASLSHDSMDGDFRRMELFIVYYSSMTELLKGVSPRFEKMATETQQLTSSSSSCCSTPNSTSP